jgi:hypothetical protein
MASPFPVGDFHLLAFLAHSGWIRLGITWFEHNDSALLRLADIRPEFAVWVRPKRTTDKLELKGGPPTEAPLPKPIRSTTISAISRGSLDLEGLLLVLVAYVLGSYGWGTCLI